MTSFDYLKFSSLKNFFENIPDVKSNYKILAGGTDLLVQMRIGSASCKIVLDVNGIEELTGIREEPGCLRIGACTTICEIANSDKIKEWLPNLAYAASQLGSTQIRNRATIGGNIVTASPAADTIPPLMAAGAKLRLKSPNMERDIALEDFLIGPGKTKINKAEVLVEIVIPKILDDVKTAFIKIGRRKALACSVINMAGWVRKNSYGTIEELRIVLGAVGPTAFRAKKTEKYLKDESFSQKAIKEATKIAASECKPIDDVRSTEEGRRLLVEGWTYRLLENLYGIKEPI